MKKCPYCAEEIQDEAILCRFCQKKTSQGNRWNLKNIICAILILGLTYLAVIGWLSFRNFRDAYEKLLKQNQEITIEKKDCQTDLEKINKELSLRTNAFEESRSKLNSALDRNSDLIIENLNIKSRVFCSSTRSFSFRNNGAMLAELKEYTKTTYDDGLVKNSGRNRYEVIWNNSDTAIHRVFGEFLYPYVVYFDEQDLGHDKTIIDLTQGCLIQSNE